VIRDADRFIIYLVWAALVAPLACVLPLYGSNALVGRTLLAVYVVGMIIFLVAGLRSMRRSSRRLGDYESEMRGVCPKCGYDLRATRDRCPECGRGVSSPDILPENPSPPDTTASPDEPPQNPPSE
jgi:hypothetical protein